MRRRHSLEEAILTVGLDARCPRCGWVPSSHIAQDAVLDDAGTLTVICRGRRHRRPCGALLRWAGPDGWAMTS